MTITELRPNVKPDYGTDPFSLVLTSAGEHQRSISLDPRPSSVPEEEFTLVYHAFSGEDAITSLRWLRSCGPWQRVIVSFSGSSEELEQLAAYDLIDELIPVANHGRNILPLLQICRDRLHPESLVLHLHGKQSLPAWREHLEAELIRDPQKRAVHRSWLAEPGHGVIAPTTYAAVKPHASWEGNFAIARALFAQAYPNLTPISPYNLLSFPAGGMFWFRARVLQRMASVVKASDFPAEPLPPDRSVAHAIERLVFHCCEAEGLEWAFAHQEQGPWPSLTSLPGLLNDWRDHYIELLLPRAHGRPTQSGETEASISRSARQILKARMKHWWDKNRSHQE